MGDQVLNVVLGVASGILTAGLGWLADKLNRRRRLNRLREFFGLPPGTDCLLVVPRQPGGARETSVSRSDAYALMEIAALVKECGAQPALVVHDQVRQGLGDKAEFCVGGPDSNDRAAAHLAWRLPGVRFTTSPDPGDGTMTLGIGEQAFSYDRAGTAANGAAYALLARLSAGSGSRPVFLVCGQTSVSNHAAVRYLAAHHRELARRFGPDGTFAVVLRVVNPKAYGPDVVELVGDLTREAATAPAEPAAKAPKPAEAPGRAESATAASSS